MKRVLVTGAAGRLGTRVVERLHGLGHEVVASDRVAVASTPGTFVQANLFDHAAIDELMLGVEVVVHLGNHPGIGSRPPQLVLSENIAMNANVFQAAVEHDVDRLVFAGTVQLIGSHVDRRTVRVEPQRPHLPLDGDTTPDPSNLYALSKAMSESMLRYYADRCGLDVAVLRFPMLHNHEPRVGVRSGEETQTDVLEAFTGLSYADAAEAVGAVVAADLSGYRVYLPAVAHRHRDLGPNELIDRFYPEVRAGTGGLVDVSALMRDTGWQPSDDYRASSGLMEAPET